MFCLKCMAPFGPEPLVCNQTDTPSSGLVNYRIAYKYSLMHVHKSRDVKSETKPSLCTKWLASSASYNPSTPAKATVTHTDLCLNGIVCNIPHATPISALAKRCKFLIRDQKLAMQVCNKICVTRSAICVAIVIFQNYIYCKFKISFSF